jgi:hypothetical protein
VLAHHHHGAVVVREHGGGGGYELHRQQQRARDVAELLVLAGRPHVEDDGPQSQQLFRLLGRHVLVRARTAVYSDGERGHGGPIIGPARGGARVRGITLSARGAR